jgi:hypothetical protein
MCGTMIQIEIIVLNDICLCLHFLCGASFVLFYFMRFLLSLLQCGHYNGHTKLKAPLSLALVLIEFSNRCLYTFA